MSVHQLDPRRIATLLRRRSRRRVRAPSSVPVRAPQQTAVEPLQGGGPVRPLLLGYQSARAATTPAALRAGRSALASYAQREGYTLGQIFLEADTREPLSALHALIEAAVREEAAAVAVPTAADLGRIPRIQHLVKQQMERAAEVRVLIITP